MYVCMYVYYNRQLAGELADVIADMYFNVELEHLRESGLSFRPFNLEVEQTDPWANRNR